MTKPKILVQLDPDPNPSVFDSVVAIDSGIDHLLTHGNVTRDNIEGLVHGAMFTRGPADLKNTALFFGGSHVPTTEAIVARALKCFFGPMRVSLMDDPNGSNTTAAAAVLCAEKHLPLLGKTITILAGTGPVGQRIAEIIGYLATSANDRATTIRVCSRKLDKATEICQQLQTKTGASVFQPVQAGTAAESLSAVESAEVVFAAGAAGVELLPATWMKTAAPPKIMIDLNAVPPAGIAGVEVMDKATARGESICYGAIGVGNLKMKIHKRGLQRLFESNDAVLQVREIYELGRSL